MAIKYALTDIPYTLQDVRLGSLVPSIKCPNQDTAGPSRSLRQGKDYKWRNQKNPEFLLQEEKGKSFREQLTWLFSFSGESAHDDQAICVRSKYS
jgi:hypothetical protein